MLSRDEESRAFLVSVASKELERYGDAIHETRCRRRSEIWKDENCSASRSPEGRSKRRRTDLEVTEMRNESCDAVVVVQLQGR